MDKVQRFFNPADVENSQEESGIMTEVREQSIANMK
jgi:hypothetical protein